MERTKTNIIYTPFAQGDKFRYHIDYVGRIKNAFDGKLVNHIIQKYKKGVWKAVLKNIMTIFFIVFQKKYLLCKHNLQPNERKS